MGKKLLLGGYLSLVVTLVLLATSCEVQTSSNNTLSSSLSPPSSAYPVDIIGHVTVAKSISSSGNVIQLSNGQEFWIVEMSIRNKTYQIPVTTKTDMWTIWESKLYLIGIVDRDFTQSNAGVSQGQLGNIILCFDVDSGTNLSNCQICLSGYAPQLNVQIPNSYGNLVNTNIIAQVYDWDLQKVTQKGTSTPTTKVGGKSPSGSYTHIDPDTIQGRITRVITFGKDTIPVTVNDSKAIVKYRFTLADDTSKTVSAEQATAIWTQNVATQEIQVANFKYIPDQDVVIFGQVDYYKN
jgi:hypothetical protein